MPQEQEKPLSIEEIAAVREPHLLDFGNVMQVATWIALLLLNLARSAAFDIAKDAVRETLTGVKRRDGRTRVREVESKVIGLISELKGKSDLSDEQINARVTEIFQDLD